MRKTNPKTYGEISDALAMVALILGVGGLLYAAFKVFS
jgi:hypothetical protein